MVRFGQKEIAKQKFYAARKTIKVWDVNVHNIVNSKLIERKINFRFLTGIKFNKAIRPLLLIMPKMNDCVNKFKVEDKNNRLMSFHTDDEKLLEKYDSIWTKIEDLKNIELNALPVYDDRYRKTKIRTYGHKIYTNFCDSNVPEDDIEYKCFTVISIVSLLVYDKKYYLRVYLDNYAYKILKKQMTDYLDKNLFED